MDKINIKGLTQSANCEQLEAIAHDYLGVQTSLDDESYGCRAGADLSLPSTINATDGVFQDTKEALAALTPKVTVNGTEYVRVLDSLSTELFNTLIGKTKMQLSDFTSLSLANQCIGSRVRDARWFKYCTQCNGQNAYFRNSSTVPSMIERVDFPSTATNFSGHSLGDGFYQASKLHTIGINSALSFGGAGMFNGTAISHIIVDSLYHWFKCTWSQGLGDCPLGKTNNCKIYLASDESTPLGTTDTPLTIPSSITTINAYALYNLKSCVNLHYAGTVNEWLSVTKGTSWHYNIGTDFIQCTDGKAGLDDTTSTGNTYE